METYLLSLGWWNLLGSFFMLGFFNQEFGQKVLNDWTRIFTTSFRLNYWSKFWLAWAIGLNIFFGAVNILAAKLNVYELQLFCIFFDLFAYTLFIILAIWGISAKRTGSGIYSVFVVFSVWLIWGIYSLIY